MIHLLTIESESESALRLGYNTLTSASDLALSDDLDLVIRWGNSSGVYDWSGNPVFISNCINKPEAIALNCNKPKALGKLASVVNTPECWLAGSTIPAGSRVVYRPVEHAGGEGFKVVKGPFKVERFSYATKYIKTDTEYRVWFVGNQTMCGVRVNLNSITDKYPCRSMWGYSIRQPVPSKLHTDTLKAAKVIGLECGAADVLFYRGKYIFLELNSAPTIDKQIIEDFYKQGLRALVAEKFPQFKH